MKSKLLSSFTFTFLSSALSFGFNFFLAKYLGAKIYGEIVYYLSFIGIVALIIGLHYTSLYMGNKINKKDDNTFSLFFTLHTLFLLLASVPLFLVIKYFVDSVEATLLILLLAYTNIFLSTVGYELNSKSDVSGSILYSALLPRFLLVILFGGVILLGNADSLKYLYALLVANGVIVVLFLYRFKPKIYFRKDIFKRAWKFYLLGIIGSSFTYISQILQKEYGSYEQLATLSIVMLFFAGFGLIGSILVKFVLPKIHEYYRDNRLSDIGELYSNNTLLVMLMVLPLIIVLAVDVRYLADFLGEGYRLLPIFFYILLIGYGVDLITGITGYMLRAMEHEHYEIFNEIARLIVGLSMIYTFKNLEYGIPLAIAVSMVVYNILKYGEIYYLFGFTPLNMKQVGYISVYIAIIFLILYIFSLIETISLIFLFQIIFLIAVYFLIYRFIVKNKYILKGYK